MARLCGVAYGVACANGTAALGLGPGDNAIVQTGATPVLVDVEPDTLCLDPAQVASAITPATKKAIIPVHMYGYPAEMEAMLALARGHGLKVIEDAAQVHRTSYHGRVLGSLGVMGCLSFFANKLITIGEGGMIVSDDPELARRLRLLRNLAHGSCRFEHHELGLNYRLTNLQAALGLAQLERLEAIKQNKDGYRRRLQPGPGRSVRDYTVLELPLPRL